MSSPIVFSIVMFKDGTVEVKYEHEGNLQVYKLKPRNPVMLMFC